MAMDASAQSEIMGPTLEFGVNGRFRPIWNDEFDPGIWC
jgi:hypothetical protein